MAKYVKESAIAVLKESVRRYIQNDDLRNAKLIFDVLDMLEEHSVSGDEIIKNSDTCCLVRELKARTDVVTAKCVGPYDTEHFDVEGPAVILVTID